LISCNVHEACAKQGPPARDNEQDLAFGEIFEPHDEQNIGGRLFTIGRALAANVRQSS
jgi:hypothetical protein